MKHSCVWTLLLLLLWAAPGCSSTEGKETATIVIAEGNSLLYKMAGEDEPITIYGPGDTVLVEWEDGTGYVNGQVYWPPPPVPPTTYPIGMLKSEYGAVPSVVEYVRTHPGEETEVWNEAYREWENQARQLTREVARQYMAHLESGKTADEAVQAALTALLASPLVSSARVEEDPDLAPTLSRSVMMRWAGHEREDGLTCDPHVTLDVHPAQPMTLDDFEAFVRILRQLERKGPATLEIKGGNMFYMSGPGTEERIEKQRRGER